MRFLNIAIKILFVISLIVAVAGFFFLDKLPRSAEITPELSNDPQQEAAGNEVGEISQDGYRAEVNTVYGYDISGLVVEEYRADNWLDFTHRNDPFNTRDLCLIWGDNVVDNNYDRIDFSHGEFTCFYATDDRTAFASFRPDQISNNHLIPADKGIAKKIDRIRKGDQVRIKGYLVDLAVEMPDGNTWTRSTSVRRDDTGNGACELVYVTDIEVLARGNGLVRQIWFIALVTALACALFLAFTFFYETVNFYYGRIK